MALPIAMWHHPGGTTMELAGKIQPIVALLAGILILIRPALLNLVVAIYLIFVGVVGIMHSGLLHS
jgi:uncharacterized membrane protein HdeD (DUF308 family)